MANNMKEARGGISFTMPIFGSDNQAINSGFNLDLPLASIQAMSNQALDFSGNNSRNAQALFNSVFQTASSNVTSTAGQVLQYNQGAQDVIAGMSNRFGQTLDNAVKKRSGMGCFITTAICKAEGKPDDCDELTTLRNFRDLVMLPNPKLRTMVHDYYAKAPEIVKAIDARADSQKCYTILRDAYLTDAVKAVKDGDYDMAITIYLDMVSSASVMADEGER